MDLKNKFEEYININCNYLKSDLKKFINENKETDMNKVFLVVSKMAFDNELDKPRIKITNDSKVELYDKNFIKEIPNVLKKYKKIQE